VLRAPGREVVTLVPGGHYDFVSGPSLATAHVSGAIALLLARNRKLDRGEIYTLLAHSAQGGAEGHAASINACRALAEMLPQASCSASRAAAALE
jgi:subtilisin family serine protease